MPTSVIQGYVRMLREGLLDDQDREKALAQIQQATGRLSELARDASSVAQWLTAPPNGGEAETPVSALVERAVAAASLAHPPTLTVAPDAKASTVETPNLQALITAFARMLEAIAREAPHETLAIHVRGTDARACDVVVESSQTDNGLANSSPDGLGAEPVTLVRGGLGLTFLLAAAVFEAHGAMLWTQAGSRGMIVRLPFKPARHS
jgi:signal transduction histidine kinase